MTERFVIPREVFLAFAESEVQATIDAMRECNILQLPFPNFDLEVPFLLAWATEDVPLSKRFGTLVIEVRNDAIVACTPQSPLRASENELAEKLTAWEQDLVLAKFRSSVRPDLISSASVAEFEKQVERARLLRDKWAGSSAELFDPAHIRQNAEMMLEVLMALLVVRNVVKTRTRRGGRAKLGHVQKAHHYTTTLNFGTFERGNSTECAGHGSPIPHLRRGHVHHFWCGPMNGERKLEKRFVQPVFVNADRAYVEGLKVQRSAYKFRKAG